MDRKVKVLVGGVGIAVLLAILATTTMGSATEFVTPTDLVETDDHDDEVVKLEGRAIDLADDEEITFTVVDENHSTSVSYDGEMPETMSDGREVVAEGYYDGEHVEASDLTVRAHEGEHPDDAGANETQFGGEYDEYDAYDEYEGYDNGDDADSPDGESAGGPATDGGDDAETTA
ncbi:cytochrome c maturation protein CcmE [Natrarchaeobaculum aegyptiacum]|uniref:Cytochrome C biogenesis protein n=1 Tax=Natrarchaeobaculum aegyptiacum TaxID=745377 RepID=A0A2Z2HUT2_9EURY|nr:cytochrome c maturation protein CcmE [Natrarchaeobaculum aegyptiacum]ARS90951.1 cytochrome C biogenesis protein [Natrarchaeobaculum aegyptiacum]